MPPLARSGEEHSNREGPELGFLPLAARYCRGLGCALTPSAAPGSAVQRHALHPRRDGQGALPHHLHPHPRQVPLPPAPRVAADLSHRDTKTGPSRLILPCGPRGRRRRKSVPVAEGPPAAEATCSPRRAPAAFPMDVRSNRLPARLSHGTMQGAHG